MQTSKIRWRRLGGLAFSCVALTLNDLSVRMLYGMFLVEPYHIIYLIPNLSIMLFAIA